MRIVKFILAVLLLSAMLAEGATSAQRSEMKAMYEENLRLAAEMQELEKSIAKVEFEIEIAEKAIENYKYVRAQNGQYIETMKP